MRPPEPKIGAARRAIMKAAAAVAASTSFGPAASASVDAGGDIVLPLMCMGSSFCTEYYVDGRRFRAVVDTGSPFLLVDGSGTATRERWGSFGGEDSPLSVPLGDVTTEGFGGQNVDVEWRRYAREDSNSHQHACSHRPALLLACFCRSGSLRLAGYDTPHQTYMALPDRVNGARAGAWTLPGSKGDALFEPINFGVVRGYQGLGGGGAIYLGLVKDRQPSRTRPTFLEQTNIQSLRLDFVARTLTLARRPLLGRRADAIPLVDLRPLGAPVASYAVRVQSLSANGKQLPLTRPVVAILDTGTTGMVIDDSLYDSDEFPLPGNAVRSVDVEVVTEGGRSLTLSAARPRRIVDEVLGTSSGGGRGGGGGATPGRPPPAEDFQFIVTPIGLNWFKRPMGVTPGEESPHVIWLGLAFLRKLQLTIDTDEMRAKVVQVYEA